MAAAAARRCIALILSQLRAAAAVLQKHFPDFLPTYLAYPYQIQRADAIRYFILYHHGGVYIDLDMGCRKRLDFLRQYNFTAPLTHPGGISNDVMAAVPGDAYLERALGQLKTWNRWMLIKYVQVGALQPAVLCSRACS